jgi:hypothetical protein
MQHLEGSELLTRRSGLYLTTPNNHKKQSSMTAVAFEPVLPTSERPQTYPLDRAATEIRFIQGVPGGMCQTSGECSLC